MSKNFLKVALIDEAIAINAAGQMSLMPRNTDI